jgi:hypothetical protein
MTVSSSGPLGGVTVLDLKEPEGLARHCRKGLGTRHEGARAMR